MPHKSANGSAERKEGFQNKRLRCLSLQNRCHEVLVKQNTLVPHGPSTTNYKAWWCHMPCQFFIYFVGPPKILKCVWLMAWLRHKKPKWWAWFIGPRNCCQERIFFSCVLIMSEKKDIFFLSLFFDIVRLFLTLFFATPFFITLLVLHSV